MWFEHVEHKLSIFFSLFIFFIGFGRDEKLGDNETSIEIIKLIFFRIILNLKGLKNNLGKNVC